MSSGLTVYRVYVFEAVPLQPEVTEDRLAELMEDADFGLPAPDGVAVTDTVLASELIQFEWREEEPEPGTYRVMWVDESGKLIEIERTDG